MKYHINLIIRLATLLALGLNLNLFYKVLTPITVYPVYFFFRLFYDARLIDWTLDVDNTYIMFIPACIAASAYFLFTVLLLTTKDIKFKLGLKILLFGFASILAVNIFRIILLLIILLNYGFNWFETVHLTIWMFVVSIFIALLWIFFVKRYKIREIPFYSDFRYLLKRLR